VLCSWVPKDDSPDDRDDCLHREGNTGRGGGCRVYCSVVLEAQNGEPDGQVGNCCVVLGSWELSKDD
jgi:hypothetical protein